MKYVKIPSAVQLGGQKIDVRQVKTCGKNGMGEWCKYQCTIDIAEYVYETEKVAEASKPNSFYHELVHGILDTMDERELSGNEKFVSTFSSFLTEAMANAYFKEEGEL